MPLAPRLGPCFALCGVVTLTGCNELLTPTSAGLFASAALVLVAVCGWHWGRWQADAAAREKIHALARQVQASQSIDPGLHWQCDATLALQWARWVPTKAILVGKTEQATFDEAHWLGQPLTNLVAEPTLPISDRVSVSALLAAQSLVMQRRMHLVGMAATLGCTQVDVSAAPVTDQSGHFKGYVGVFRPVLEPTPEAPQSPLENEALSMGFTLSHDLRAPVRVVEGFARILKEDYTVQIDRVGMDHLDRVLGAAARMNQMIDAMLMVAKLASQPLARQDVDLSQLARFVVEDLRRGAPERQISIDIEPAIVVQGDPTLLRQLLDNLLGNAWKYTQRTAEPQMRLSRLQGEGEWVYVVSDNGAGFDMRSVERLFGLFQRLHSANDFPGTGVGLASVKRIVARHGGRIWAVAEPGQGAAFHFTLRG